MSAVNFLPGLESCPEISNGFYLAHFSTVVYNNMDYWCLVYFSV